MIFLHKLLSFLAKFSSPILTYLELKALNNYSAKALSHQPIFIVGAPRSGSTILFQALTNSCELTYFDNFTSAFYRNIFLGYVVSNFLFRGRAHNVFSSEFGDTRRYGFMAPSESGKYWGRFFLASSPYSTPEGISKFSLSCIKRDVSAIINKSKRPLIIKNLILGQRLAVIAKIFPSARIIFIQRNVSGCSESILNARVKLGIPGDQWWSVRPKDFRALQRLPLREMCSAQVLSINEQIESDLDLFNENNVFRVDYDGMNAGLIREIAGWLEVDCKGGETLPSFNMDCS